MGIRIEKVIFIQRGKVEPKYNEIHLSIQQNKEDKPRKMNPSPMTWSRRKRMTKGVKDEDSMQVNVDGV